MTTIVQDIYVYGDNCEIACDDHPVKLNPFIDPNETIVKVCVTSVASFVLTTNGSVYGTGWFAGGDLSVHGYFVQPTTDYILNNQNRIRRIQNCNFRKLNCGGFEKYKITNMESGCNIVMFFTDDNQVFALGENSYGSIGHRDIHLLKQLTKVASFLDETEEYIVHLAPCFSSCLISTNLNRVYILGQISWFNKSGGYHARIEYESDSPIKRLSGGNFHASILNQWGQVFVCGEGSPYNKLGIAEQGCVSIRELKTIREPIVFNHCEADYSIYVTLSQRVILCGFSDLNKNRVNDIDYIVELVGFVPRTPIIHISSTQSRIFINTMDGLYVSKGSELNKLYRSHSIDSDLKMVEVDQEAVFSRKPSTITGQMIAVVASSHAVFYAHAIDSCTFIGRHFPRLWDNSKATQLSDVLIQTVL